MDKILAVVVGGSIGALCRYWVGIWALARLGGEFPYGTFIVNVTGCFIIGCFMTFIQGIQSIMPDSILLKDYVRLLVTTGFVGTYTTFSTYSYETFVLLEKGSVLLAFWNVTSNLLVGFSATWLGICAAKFMVKLFNT